MNKDSITRKKQLEDRLERHGIKGYLVHYLPYMDFDDRTFASPYETGGRMMIFYAIAYAAYELDKRKNIIDWLKRENIWSQVSPNEREFLEGKVTDEQKIIDFSWQSENAYILAWALNLVKNTPSPSEPISEERLDELRNNIPALGEKLSGFLNNLRYRNTADIYDENLFHEMATTYFRDLLFNGKRDESDIDRSVSFLRHQTLNWLRRFMNIEEWDETDTST